MAHRWWSGPPMMVEETGSVGWGPWAAGCSPAMSPLGSQRWGWWRNGSRRSSWAVQWLRVFPTPKMHQRVWQTEPKGRFILEQKRWGLRRLGQPGAGLVRGWCFVLAQRVDKELVGEHTSQLWVRTETLSQAWTNHPEAGRHRAGEKGFSSEDSGLELRSQLGSLNLSEPLLP